MKPFVLPLCLAALFLGGCGLNFQNTTLTTIRGSGKEATETRKVSGFDGITLNITGDITLEQGEEESITITTDDNVLAEIKTEVSSKTLTIETDHKNVSFQNNLPIHYTIRVKDLRALQINGAGNVRAENLKTDGLNLTIAGMGNIDVNSLDTPTLKVSIPGSGVVTLKGSAATQDYTVNGMGTLNTGDLKGDNAKVKISGSGGGTLWVEKTLDITISGMGNLKYYGSPTLTQKIQGAGNIQSLGAH